MSRQSIATSAAIETTPVVTSPTIAQRADIYIDQCKRRIEYGEILTATVLDYEQVLHRMISFVGGDSEPSK